MKKQNEVVVEINGRRQKISGVSNEVIELLESDKYASGCYHISDFTDHRWQLPDSPLQMEVELDYIHPDDRTQILYELGLDGQEVDVLEFYVERTQGIVQSVTINDIRFESLTEIPVGVMNFLDGLVFGDPADPVSTGSGERVSFWDAVRGAPETQQAFYDYGYQNTETGLTLHGQFDVRHSLHELDSQQEKRLADTVSQGATRVEISSKKAAERSRPGFFRWWMKAALVLALLAVSVAAGLGRWLSDFF